MTDPLTINNTVAMARQSQIVDKVLFLDGISGTGKTMMGPILGTFERVEMGRFEHNFEYHCALNALGKIEPDAAAFMIKMLADLCLYNMMISREVNLRPTDLSGAFSNPHPLRYLKRLFVKDGKIVLERIKNEKPVLHLISHQALGIMHPVFRAFGSKVHVVEMVRHPAYLVDHWCTYIDRFGTDPRDFTVWFDHQGRSLPWFACGWEERYMAAPSLEKVIYTLSNLAERSAEFKKGLNKDLRNNILTIPFEHFVLDPEPFIKHIELLLSSRVTSATYRVLSQQKVPRLQVAAGPNKEIYRRYAWSKPNVQTSDREELQQKKKTIGEKLGKEAGQMFEKICSDYENTYRLWF